MRVAIVNHGIFPFLLGGMERHTHFLADHLSRLGVDVDVIIPQLSPANNDRLSTLSLNYKLTQCPWPEKPVWLWSNYLFSRYAARYLQSQRYDAVYCQGLNGWAFLESARGRPHPFTLLNPHGLEMFKALTPIQRMKLGYMRWAAWRQAALADRVVSLGGGLTDETIKYLRVDPSRIDVLPNAIDVDYLDIVSASELGKDASDSEFIFIGRLELNKGAAVLCETFRQLPTAQLTIVGSGRLEAALRRQFEGGNIRFTGSLSELAMFSLLRQSSCLVFTSLYEGMPTVILEAMAIGLPVIATNIGAVNTMVDATTGILIPPNSVEKLKDAVQSFQMLPEHKRKQMGEIGRRRVIERYTWAKIAQQTLDVIKQNI